MMRSMRNARERVCQSARVISSVTVPPQRLFGSIIVPIFLLSRHEQIVLGFSLAGDFTGKGPCPGIRYSVENPLLRHLDRGRRGNRPVHRFVPGRASSGRAPRLGRRRGGIGPRRGALPVSLRKDLPARRSGGGGGVF